MAKGIRRLDSREPLPWGLEETATSKNGEKPISLLVRFLVIGKTIYKDRVVLAYNFADQKGSRRPGWGIPGGRVQEGETALEALQKRKAGEIPWPIVGDPVHIHTSDRERRDRIERTYVFLVAVDEANRGKIAAGEALEVSEARFFTIPEILKLRTVDTRPRAMVEEMRNQERGIYKSHGELLAESLKAYKEYVEEGLSPS